MQKLKEKENYDLEKINRFISDLVKKEMITSQEAENINPHAILKFTQSYIWEEMKEAKEIQKEKPFYITLPAKEVYDKEVEENVLIQGMIDLYYINQKGELILVDYKTDFVREEEELIEKYRKQLELYQKALEEALQKKVDHVYLYSTFLGKALEVLKS